MGQQDGIDRLDPPSREELDRLLPKRLAYIYHHILHPPVDLFAQYQTRVPAPVLPAFWDVLVDCSSTACAGDVGRPWSVGLVLPFGRCGRGGGDRRGDGPGVGLGKRQTGSEGQSGGGACAEEAELEVG
jgi:hypothetical protein